MAKKVPTRKSTRQKVTKAPPKKEMHKSTAAASLEKKEYIQESVTRKQQFKKLVFEGLWLKNRNDLIKYNITSLDDLHKILQKVAAEELKLPALDKEEASLLIQELFWIELIKSAEIRKYLLQSQNCKTNLKLIDHHEFTKQYN